MSDPIGYIYASGTDREVVYDPEDITVVYAAPTWHRHDFVGDQDTCTWPDCRLTYGEYRIQVQHERDKG